MNRFGAMIGSLAHLMNAPMRYNYHHPLFGRALRAPVARNGTSSTGKPPANGKREIARRTRQVAAGSLKYENGYRPK